MENKNIRKQSILVGGLISTAGYFIAKVLGILYVVPFDAILQTAENQSYYSITFSIYSYILQIATAGLPFATATLVARYNAREDYKTCLLVKKISSITMLAFGFLSGSVLILCSGVIAKTMLPEGCDLTVMRNAIILISLCLFVVPTLSSLRGYYQGLKEMELYSVSQVLEQVVRILFLLGMGVILVYLFKVDAVWAMYFSIVASSISGIVTVLYIRRKGKSIHNEVIEKANVQSVESNTNVKDIFKELLFISVPYLLSAVFGYCDSIINTATIGPGLEAYGKMLYTPELASAINMHATKIIAIPMILVPGFSGAIVPYITDAIEKKNKKLTQKYIFECIESVIYLALPICFLLFVYAQTGMFVMFGGNNLEMDTFVMKWYALEALCATVAPIFTQIVMVIGGRKEATKNTILFAIIKLCTNQLFISIFGVGGMVLSSLLGYIVCVGFNVLYIQRKFHLNWIYTLRKIIFMILGLIAIYVVSIPFNLLGWITYTDSRLVSLLLLAIMGLVSCGIYALVTGLFQIPQSIFNINFSSILEKVKRKLGK